MYHSAVRPGMLPQETHSLSLLALPDSQTLHVSRHCHLPLLLIHADFGLAVTLLIAINCVALALYEPLQPDSEGRNLVLKNLGELGEPPDLYWQHIWRAHLRQRMCRPGRMHS